MCRRPSTNVDLMKGWKFEEMDYLLNVQSSEVTSTFVKCLADRGSIT